MGNSDRDRILARRRKLIAAAVAGMGAASACEKQPSRYDNCLAPLYVPEADAGPRDDPPEDAGVTSTSDAPSVDPPDANPTVCLSVEEPPDAEPQICLSAPEDM